MILKNYTQKFCKTSESSSSTHESVSMHSSAQSEGSNLSSIPSISLNDLIPTESFKYSCKCISSLKTASGALNSLVVVGDVLFSGSSDNGITVWRRQPELQELMNFCKDKGGAVKSIVGWRDLVFTAHHDHKIRVWKVLSNYKTEKLATLPTLKDYLANILTIFPSKYVQIRRHKKVLWIQHADAVSALAVRGDESLYSASWDRTVKVWRLTDWRCVESFRAHDDAINAIVVSKDGFVYTGSADKTIKVWMPDKKDKHALVATLVHHKSPVNALALSSNGSLLYSGACDKALLAWQRSEEGGHMRVCGAMRGHKAAILCIATWEDIVCSGSADKTVRVWRRGEGNLHTCIAILQGHDAPVKSIAVCKSQDSSSAWCVYSGDIRQELRVWLVSCITAAGRACDSAPAVTVPLSVLRG